MKLVKRIYFLIFDQIGIISLFKALLIIKFKKNILIHFIYPENTYAWLHKFKNDNNKICCTFHQPIEFYKKNTKWINIIRQIDIIIVLAENDVSFFKEITKKPNVYYIPHGIDTDFYDLNLDIKKRNNILMVGNWLRNFDFARSVFKEILENNISNEINIVTNKENFKYFNDLKINLFEDISDESLKILYQESKICFFPLFNFTANNAMLEAASTGSNIILVSEFNSNNIYFPKDSLIQLPFNLNLVVNQMIKTLLDKDDNFNNKKLLHDYCVQNYSWKTISKKTVHIFNQF